MLTQKEEEMLNRRSFVKFLASAVVAKSLLIKVANDELDFVADVVKKSTQILFEILRA